MTRASKLLNKYEVEMLVTSDRDINYNNFYKDELIAFCKCLRECNKNQQEIIDRTIDAIDLVIELIKQQPTEDDRWILARLNGFKTSLEDKEV